MSLEKASVLGAVLCVAGISGSASAAVVPTTVAQWDFDSATSDANITVVADVSGKGHDGTWSSSKAANRALNADNPFGQADNHSLSVTYIGSPSIANVGDIDLSSGFTIEGWMKPSSGDGTMYIANLFQSGQPWAVTLGVNNANTSGEIYVQLRKASNDNRNIFTGVTVNLDEWNYLALTYDGRNANVYLLNSTHPVDPVTQALRPIATVDEGTGVTFRSSWTSASIGTNGISGHAVLYDDIRISNVVLSDSELGYHGSFTQIPEPAGLSALALGGLLMLRRRGRCRFTR